MLMCRVDLEVYVHVDVHPDHVSVGGRAGAVAWRLLIACAGPSGAAAAAVMVTSLTTVSVSRSVGVSEK